MLEDVTNSCSVLVGSDVETHSLVVPFHSPGASHTVYEAV